MNNSTSFISNSFTSSDIKTTQFPEALAFFVLLITSINMFGGTAGNFCICILLWRRPRNLRKVPHFLLGSLALTGLVSALCCMPLLILMTVIQYFPIHTLPFAICLVNICLSSSVRLLNSLTLCLMALDRQDCVLRPHSRRLTARNVKKVIASTWLVVLILPIVFATLLRNEPFVCFSLYHVNNKSKRPKIFEITAAVFGQVDILTITLVLVTSIRIVNKIRSSPVDSSTSAHQRQEKRLTQLALKICGSYVLFKIPIMISSLIAKIGNVQKNTGINAAILVCITFSNCLYVLNPVFYRRMLNVPQTNRASAGENRG